MSLFILVGFEQTSADCLEGAGVYQQSTYVIDN